MDRQKLKIGVLMGGLSPEREVSFMSGRAVMSALEQSGHNVCAIDAGRDVAEKLIEEGIEIVFIALHGRFGEDGTIQGLLDMMGLPYTGSPVLASAVAMDKCMSKEVFRYHRIPTPGFEVMTGGEFRKNGDKGVVIQPPVVVKPSNGGSTIGVTIVHDKKELNAGIAEALRWDNRVLIESYIDGPLVTVGVLGDRALPAIEVAPKSGFYDYTAKYTSGKTEYFLPARISGDTQKECERLALRAHGALQCRGATRTDMIVAKDGIPHVLEVNTIPGMTETSLLPKAAKAAGLDFVQLAEEILDLAIKQWSVVSGQWSGKDKSESEKIDDR